MKTQVTALYEFAKEKYNLTLVAGKKGLRNSVSWTYLAEDIHNIRFLKGGELVITTGLFISTNVTLQDFIKEMAMKNCSCIILNVGKYIVDDDISEEIMNFCDTNKLPLFTLPWEVHLVEIMQDYGRLLLQDSQQEDNLSAAFQSALYQATIPDHVLRILNHYDFPTVAAYRIIIIQNLHDSTIITSPLNHYGVKYHLFFYDNLKILIYHPMKDQLPLQKMIELLCYCDSVILGISDEFQNINALSQSYKRARFAFAAAVFWQRPYVSFDDLGVFQILFSNSNPDLLRNIYKKHLGLLEDYDLKHDSEYVNTLRFYLLSDCNLIETASRLFTHRNTIVYRIRKIKDLLGTELDNSAVKFDLLLSFYIREYFLI